MTYMINQDKEWEDYLLNIGVTNLNDQAEINRKLEEVERANSEYQSTLKEAVDEMLITTSKPIECINKKDIVHWLLSLGN